LHQVLVRAAKNFLAHQMTDRAATLTYYAMMSLFPALLVGVTLLGLFGQQGLVTDATDYLLDHGVDGDTAKVVSKVLDNMVNASGGTLGATLVVSVVLALNGASGAFGAAGRALNLAYGIEESRGMVRRKLTDLATTLVVIVLFAVVLASIFLGGQIADDLFGKIGLGSTAATVWSYARWPVALVAATVAYGLVYGVAPNVEPRRIRWITPGAVVGVVLWIVLSLGFSIYVRNFSSYGAVYGAFAAAIVLLLWLYLSANAFLFGAELNAELGAHAGEAGGSGSARDQASSRSASSRSVSSGG
jgi:membrane protein